MIFAAVLAGGSGLRMKNSTPKQFLPLGGKPVIVRTLEVFLQLPEIRKIYLGMNGDYLEEAQRLLGEYLPEQASRMIELVPGGADRNESLLHVADRIAERWGEEGHLLITHDGVRPFVTPQMLRESLEGARQVGASGTAIPSTDTLFYSEDGERVLRAADRSRYFRAQTPQSFRLSLIRDLLRRLGAEERSRMTDACSLCLAEGLPVVMTPGSPLNIKLTTPEDLALAEALLGLK